MIEINPEFKVVAEGDGWIVVDKAAPLIVHPANDRGLEATLLGGVQQLLAYEITCGASLSIINRLDRETSGIVLLATRKSVAREMSRAMERRLVKKRYQAIVEGWPEWNEICVDAPIVRKGEIEDSQIYVEQMVHHSGRPCTTQFHVAHRYLKEGKKFSLLNVSPLTGRMHQIRVHAAYLGHPIIGDKIYGDRRNYLEFIETGLSEEMLRRLMLRRHALHAMGLSMMLNDREHAWDIELAEDLTAFLAGATLHL